MVPRYDKILECWLIENLIFDRVFLIQDSRNNIRYNDYWLVPSNNFNIVRKIQYKNGSSLRFRILVNFFFPNH